MLNPGSGVTCEQGLWGAHECWTVTAWSYGFSQTLGVLVWILRLYAWFWYFPGQASGQNHFILFCLTHKLCAHLHVPLLQAEILENVVHRHLHGKNPKLNWLCTQIHKHSRRPLGSRMSRWLVFLSCHLKVSRSTVIKDKCSPWTHRWLSKIWANSWNPIVLQLLKQFITSVKSPSGLLCCKKLSKTYYLRELRICLIIRYCLAYSKVWHCS